MNYFNFPLVLPFRFVKMETNPGVGFYDRLDACSRREFEMKGVIYYQKWIRSITTKLQCESSIQPGDLVLCTKYGEVIKSFAWVAVFTGVQYKIYQTTFDVTDVVDDGVYFLYQKTEFLTIKWEDIANPIYIKNSWENVRIFRYKNKVNDFDTYFTGGLEMKFICEADVHDYDPDFISNNITNQLEEIRLLSATPIADFQLLIGDAKQNVSGVAPYVLELLNRIFCLTFVAIGNEYKDDQYAIKPGSKWKPTRQKPYPLVGASIDVNLSKNPMSLQHSQTEDDVIDAGIITSYEIETDFFGEPAIVPITEVEENG